MGLSRLDGLYMAVVAEHSKHPHHYGCLEEGTAVQLNNPTCGDVIHLSLSLKGNQIEDLAFTGEGCTISTASASMMTDVVKGKTPEEALRLATIFSEMVQGKKDAAQDDLGDAAFLAGVARFPQRIKCATLAWNVLKKALEQAQKQADV